MKRRDLIKLAPVTLAAGAVPLAGSASEETPIMQAYHVWLALKEEESAAPASMSDEDFDVLCHHTSEHENYLMALSASSGADWLIKVAVWSDFGAFAGPDNLVNPQLWAEARTLIGGVA